MGSENGAKTIFQRAFRKGQGHFRNSSPTISEAGRTPDDEKGKRNSHLLAIGHEAENLMPVLRGDDGAISFFKNRGIHWWRSGRSGDSCMQDIPTRNLASSQIACVNFLLPLASIDGALETLLQAVDQDVERVESLAYKGMTSKVDFEWIGLGSSLEGGAGTRGAKTTSIDALLVASARGVRIAYLLEWKCCEEYTEGEFLGGGPSGDTRRGRYGKMYSRTDSSFNGQAPLDELLYDPFYQLMRMHLLGDRMVREREFGATEFMVVVVCPEENTAYRNTITSPGLSDRFPQATTVLDAMRTTLKTPTTLRMISQSSLLSALRSSPCSPSIQEWAAYHQERYGW